MNYPFEESEMPYGILERFGLTQEMMEDLPTDVLQNIYNGRLSPVLPIRITTDDGEEVKARTKIRLIRKPDGAVDILFHPQLDGYELSRFDEAQQMSLKEGKAIIGHLESMAESEEAGTKCFFQIDPESKQVLSVPTPVMGRNLQYVADRYRLTAAELQKLQHGELLVLLDAEDDEITVGIDLNAATGIRFAAGDETTWRREAKRDWDKYNFGIYGCWTMDDEGNLDYTPEEDYSEEIWQEQKKMGLRAMQR